MKKWLKEKDLKKEFIFSFKIAIGMYIAILFAEELKLDFATSAGTITLLTILSTKWATVKLAGSRILSCLITILLCVLLFTYLGAGWESYGLFMFLLAGICSILSWKSTISVNAVIGVHLLSVPALNMEVIWNEFYLVLIGVTISIIINLFQGNRSQKETIIKDMRSIEWKLRRILLQITDYLMQKENAGNVWDEIKQLEEHLEKSSGRAHEYQDNTFVSHPEYYIRYIDMRIKQCGILHNLHYEIKKIRKMPEQAKTIASYMEYMSKYVTEMNIPREQLERLEQMKENFRQEQLPVTREEFESRAVLYHIMMDLEEFLIFKKRFVDALDEKQKKIYWRADGKFF